MAWPAGLQLLETTSGFYVAGTGNKRRFAEQINSIIMTARGNKVISGCAPTVGGQVDLSIAGNHLNVAAGEVLIAGTMLAFSTDNVDLSGAQNPLTSGNSRYVLITIYNSGGTATLRATNGGMASNEDQEPPETPEDEVDVCIIYLTESDDVMSGDQIGDWRQFTEDGIALIDNAKIFLGDIAASGSIYFDGTDLIIDPQETGAGTLKILGDLDLIGNSLVGTGFSLGTTELGWLEDIYDTGVTSVEFDYLDGSTENIQAALNAAARFADSETITGAWTIDNATGLTFQNQLAGGHPILKSSHATLQELQLTGHFDIVGTGEVSGNFDISGHDLSTVGLKLAGTLVTSSAAELNVLDGVTAFSGTPSDIANNPGDGTSTVIPRLDHVHAHPSGLTSNLHHTKYALLDDLIANEIAVIKEIDDASINNTKWDYLAGMTEDPQTFMDSFGTITGTPSIDQSLLQASSPTFIGLTLSADLVTTNTVDGRDVSADGTKLDGIENNATADQTKSDIEGLAIQTVGTITSGIWNAGDVLPNTDGVGNCGTALKTWATVRANAIYHYDATPSGGTDVVLSGNRLWYKSSSDRFKENIQPFIADTSRIYELVPYSFKYIGSEGEGSRSYGYIAEDVEKIYPEAVSYVIDEKGERFPLSYDVNRIQVLIVEELKLLRERVIQLEQMVVK